jgi:hypothetical protein
VEILTLLADHGRQRAPSAPGLIVAGAAERAGLTVLPCDRVFDLTAGVTGQGVE